MRENLPALWRLINTIIGKRFDNENVVRNIDVGLTDSAQWSNLHLHAANSYHSMCFDKVSVCLRIKHAWSSTVWAFSTLNHFVCGMSPNSWCLLTFLFHFFVVVWIQLFVCFGPRLGNPCQSVWSNLVHHVADEGLFRGRQFDLSLSCWNCKQWIRANICKAWVQFTKCQRGKTFQHIYGHLCCNCLSGQRFCSWALNISLRYNVCITSYYFKATDFKVHWSFVWVCFSVSGDGVGSL